LKPFSNLIPPWPRISRLILFENRLNIFSNSPRVMNHLLFTQIPSYILHDIPNVCPFVTLIKITNTKSKHNILYIRWFSDLKSKNHLHNRHVSFSINIDDLSIWNPHAGQFNIHVLWQTYVSFRYPLYLSLWEQLFSFIKKKT